MRGKRTLLLVFVFGSLLFLDGCSSGDSGSTGGNSEDAATTSSEHVSLSSAMDDLISNAVYKDWKTSLEKRGEFDRIIESNDKLTLSPDYPLGPNFKLASNATFQIQYDGREGKAIARSDAYSIIVTKPMTIVGMAFPAGTRLDRLANGTWSVAVETAASVRQGRAADSGGRTKSSVAESSGAPHPQAPQTPASSGVKIRSSIPAAALSKLRKYEKWPFDPTEAKRRQNETARILGVPVEKEFDLGDGVKLPMVLIPAGQFMMGSPPNEEGRKIDEKLHQVTLTQPFCIGKYEVTVDQWFQVMETRAGASPGWPINNIERDDILEFCGRLSLKFGIAFDLPTEAQWEYACRSGSDKPWFFLPVEEHNLWTLSEKYDIDVAEARRKVAEYVSDFNKQQEAERLLESLEDNPPIVQILSQYAQFRYFNIGSGVAGAAGNKKPNYFGVYDMVGNVEEMCRDNYGNYGSQPAIDPCIIRNGSDTYVIRGVALGNKMRGYKETSARSAYREGISNANTTDTRWSYGRGFRVVCVP